MRILAVIQCVFLLGSMTCFAQEPKSEGKIKEYDNPGRFEKDIQRFEDRDKKQFPPAGAIVCIGSSSMACWHPTIVEDLAPLTVIKRGFGGSNMNDALYFSDRIVIPYKPRAILLYEGDNDIAAGVSPQNILDTFRLFVDKMHKQLPGVRIYVMSIKPSPIRWSWWPKMEGTNFLIEKECSQDKLLVYVDVATDMLDVNKEPLKDIFLDDKLHMTRGGYDIWREAVKPILIKRELPFEPQKNGNVAEKSNNTESPK